MEDNRETITSTFEPFGEPKVVVKVVGTKWHEDQDGPITIGIGLLIEFEDELWQRWSREIPLWEGTLDVQPEPKPETLDTSFKPIKLKQVLLEKEGEYISAALKESGGRVSKAASLLGISHQTLSNILKYRQKALAGKRLPAEPRKWSIIHANFRRK